MSEATAGEVLTEVVADLRQKIRDRRPEAVADEPDAVHQLRTAVRRLRNVLAAFRKCFDADATAELRERLKTYGDILGECRDLEVRADHCAAAIAELGLEGDLHEPLVVPLLAAHRTAHDALVVWHHSAEAAALDTLLDLWGSSPPLADRAMRPVEKVATKAVRKQVDRTLAAAHRLDDPEHPEEVHDVRKAARRLRHTADAVTSAPADVLGDWAVHVGDLGTRIQRMLGEQRDALLLARHVQQYGAGAPDPTPYLTLVAHAERTAREEVRGLPAVLLELRDSRRP